MGLGVGRAGESFLPRVVRWRYGDNYDNFHSIYDSNVSSSIGEVSKWFSRERISVYITTTSMQCVLSRSGL